MRVLFFILCFVVSIKAVSLKDYKPLVFEILDSKNTESNSKDSTQNIESKSPQRRLLELSGEYAKEHLTFVDTLQKYAITKEQQDFITHYKTYLQWAILGDTLQFYIKNHSTPQDLRTKESEFIKFINDFLQEQSDIIASFGSEFFTFLDSMNDLKKPCIGASCGHVNEVFIISNMLEQNRNKMSENIANYALSGYQYYVLMQPRDSVETSIKELDFNNLSQKDLEYLLSQKQNVSDMDDDKLLEIFGNFLFTEYLARLYAGRYALYFLKSSDKNALLKSNPSPCNYPKMLEQKGKDICQREFFVITTNDFYPGVIITLDSKNCLFIAESKDSAKPKMIKSPTNNDKMCKDIIKKFESVF